MVQKILILSSNPRRDLNLDREVSDLTTAVQRLGMFEIALGLGVQSHELQNLLIEHNPQIVHFCGHGAGEQGLVFQDEHGRERLVSTEVLTRLFKILQDEVNCLVLNACDSDRQAEAIVAHINYVIGMSQPILDQAAYIFAVGFYKGLAAGKPIEQAYELGCIAVQIWSEDNAQSAQFRQQRKAEYVGAIAQPAQPNLPEYLKPVLRKKSTLQVASTESSAAQEVALTSLVTELPSGSIDKIVEQGTEQEDPVAKNSEAEVLASAMPEPPQGFEETIRQEIDRKEYKDQARVAYDRFGQFSATSTANLTKAEYGQRKIYLEKVKEFWIEGFLKPSLQENSVINRDWEDRQDAIASLSQGIEALSVELDDSFDRVRPTQIYEEIGQGRTLLILGDPGAGKTIALLQLAQRLIERSEQDLSLPMPIVFTLSSWAKEQKRMVDWLMDELREKYQVSKALSEPWITQQQLILLLDGLDEVKEEHRNTCVRSLNEFISLFPKTEIAVCSRVKDYEALTERLQISSALCLQPFSSKQVYQFLDSAGGALQGLKALLQRDPELEKFAQTPLILNLMGVAYQGWSVQDLIPHLHSNPDRHHHLFDTYIDRRLEQGATSEYRKDDLLRWLSWLANRMVQEKQTIFLIEKMQPTWLQNRSERRAYRIKTFLFAGLSAGLISGLIGGLIVGLTANEVYTYDLVTAELIKERDATLSDRLESALSVGRGLGLLVGLGSGLIAGLTKKISPLERLSWSWQRVRSRIVREFFTGISVGFFVALIETLSNTVRNFNLLINERSFRALIYYLTSDLSAWLSNGLGFGLWFGLFFGLFSGFGSAEIEQRTVPNQGIRSSWRNCMFIGLGVTLLIALLIALFSQTRDLRSLANGLSLGLFFGSILGLKYGGTACVQHFTLRQMLHQKGRIPWNYAKFLDFASGRRLMKKVGGGYVFYHRMLMEHFANKSPN